MGNEKIKVIICGVLGKMGHQSAMAIQEQKDMVLVGAVDVSGVGQIAGKQSADDSSNIRISGSLDELIVQTKPDVMVDFTKGHIAPGNITKCLENGIACVVGTTGISDEDTNKIRKLSEEKNTPVFIAPNFSVGAVLMMNFAKEAAKYFEWAEISELHHEKKADAPSGTALKTAEMMSEVREKFQAPVGETEKVTGVRGGVYHGIHVHSIRLPGLLAHQEVLFGSLGETLKIRHDSLSRECFMPGVILSVRKVKSLSGVVIGLDKIM
jgi:4-hydroxy-tetrahydrodipicolinate reductase